MAGASPATTMRWLVRPADSYHGSGAPMKFKKLLRSRPTPQGAINVAATPLCIPDYFLNPHAGAMLDCAYTLSLRCRGIALAGSPLRAPCSIALTLLWRDLCHALASAVQVPYQRGVHPCP